MSGGIDPRVVRRCLTQARERIDRAAQRVGRDPRSIEILLASKYVALQDMGALAEAGVTLVGENRAQDLVEKADAYKETFTWDFIGTLQSRKVRIILPYVRMIHSLASVSALHALERHASEAKPGLEVLIEVDLAGEQGKQGAPPELIPLFLERSPIPITGLAAMPPATNDPMQSKRWFAMLRELAEAHHLPKLSIGTSQDYLIAVEEGASIVRLGRSLLSETH